MANRRIMDNRADLESLRDVKELSIRKTVIVGNTTVEVSANVWRAWNQSWTANDIDRRIITARALINETLKSEIRAMKSNEIVRVERETLSARRGEIDENTNWETYGLY